MKRLKDYSEEIYKCTKCGLCQAVCPVFQETGQETAVSRGKFTLLYGILTGKVKFTKNIKKYLDMCLGCRACYDFCPSGIYADKIIEAARAEYAELHGISPLKKIILFFLVILSGAQRSRRIFSKDNKGTNLVYFPGCMSTSTKAVQLVLEKNGFNVYIPKNFSCCGMAAKNSGDIDTFKRLSKHNIAQIPDNIDYILTECASCGSAWQEYPDEIAQKVVNIYKFLDDADIYIPEGASYNHTVTWHDPCHLVRFQDVKEEPRNLLRKIPDLTFKEMNEADRCCGAAGTFCITKPQISLAISKQKGRNIIDTGADIVSTSCSGCKIGLMQGLACSGKVKPILSPIEILAEIYSQC